jgi:2-alkyl-3-oxoalkanoate reductase
MICFITGGNGFLGSEVIRRLLSDGHEVKALARSDSSAATITKLGATPVKGDLSNIHVWQESLRGCDAVVHCAAPVEFWGPWQKFEDEIVKATKNLHTAATAMGVRKFIHVSSESVLQDREALLDIDETCPYPMVPNSFYGKAKMLAEKALLQSVDAMNVIILRPTFIWGDGCAALSEIAARARSGAFRWVESGTCSFEAVHVKNVAEAILLAAKLGTGKKVYFVTDDEGSTVREFFTAFFTAVGIPVPEKSMPNFIVRPLAGFVECIWKVLGLKKPPPLSRFEWAFVAMSRRYNIAKIKSELGYRPVISRVDAFKKISIR